MLNSSVAGSSQNQKPPSSSSAPFTSIAHVFEPKPEQSCAESLHRGADESRDDIRQGAFLLQVSLSLALAVPSQASRLESGLSALRNSYYLYIWGMESSLLSADNESAIEDKLDALAILDPVKEAYALLQDAEMRYAESTDRRGEGGGKSLIFTSQEIKKLTELQLALQVNYRELWDLSDAMAGATKELERTFNEFNSVSAVRLLPDSSGDQFLEWFDVKVDGSAEEVPYPYSGLQFWCELLYAGTDYDSLSVMLCEDFEDFAPITKLDVVQRGINALEEDSRRRLNYAKENLQLGLRRR